MIYTYDFRLHGFGGMIDLFEGKKKFGFSFPTKNVYHIEHLYGCIIYLYYLYIGILNFKKKIRSTRCFIFLDAANKRGLIIDRLANNMTRIVPGTA